MSSTWINERIESIYTRVKNKVMTNLYSTYPDLNFTMDDSENVNPKFPSVYMYFDATERGQTLDGGAINAVYMTVQTRVKATMEEGNEVAIEVNTAVRDAMKDLLFVASGSPIPTTSGDVKVINSNYGRVLGQADSIP